jgi:tetratricopeptide (TPR) repeat protein
MNTHGAPIREREVVATLEGLIIDGRRELRPDLAAARLQLAIALGQRGQLEEAATQCSQAIVLYEQLIHEGRIELRASLAKVRFTRGIACGQQFLLEEAAKEYCEAIGLYEELIREDQSQLSGELAEAHYNLGHTRLLQSQPSQQQAALPGQMGIPAGIREGERQPDYLNGATSEFRRVIQLCEQLRSAGRADFLDLLASARNNLGAAVGARYNLGAQYGQQGRFEEAAKEFRQVIQLCEQLKQEEQTDVLRELLSMAQVGLEEALNAQGKMEVAGEVMRRAQPDRPEPLRPAEKPPGFLGKIFRRLFGKASGSEPAPASANNLEVFLTGIEQARAELQLAYAGRASLDEAVRTIRHTIKLGEKLLAQGLPQVEGYLAFARMDLGAALGDLGRMDEAAEEFGKVIQCYEKTLRDKVNVRADESTGQEQLTKARITIQGELAKARMNRGSALLGLQRDREAVEELRQAAQLHETLVNQGHVEWEYELAKTWMNLGAALNCVNLYQEAVVALRRATDLFSGWVQRGQTEYEHELARTRVNFASALLNADRLEEAATESSQAVRFYQQGLQEGRMDLMPEWAKAQALDTTIIEKRVGQTSSAPTQTGGVTAGASTDALAAFQTRLAATQMELQVAAMAPPDALDASLRSVRETLAQGDQLLAEGHEVLNGALAGVRMALAVILVGRGRLAEAEDHLQ